MATRVEIDRVIAELTGLETWLREQVLFMGIDPSLRMRLALELTPILTKLDSVRSACGQAADSYFGVEAEISRELREGHPPNIEKIATGFAGVGATLGLLIETPVTSTLVGVSNRVVPPNSIGELAKRLNLIAELGPAWIRIEKFREPATLVSAEAGYISPSTARYIVYIPGTQAWSPQTSKNPLDLTSNLSAISKTGFAGSERAVALAMEQAGIKPDSPVLLVGHSQGGLLAANISTRYAGSKVLTFGAPISQLSGRLSGSVLSVEHDGDLVPGLDFRPNPLETNWVTVRQKLAGADPLKQHEMAGYLRTALDIDEVEASGGLAKLRQEIADFAGDFRVEGQALDFEISRTKESAKP
ncbi:MAG: hypothetical protein ACKOWI_05040 [Rhodoluna sp.]